MRSEPQRPLECAYDALDNDDVARCADREPTRRDRVVAVRDLGGLVPGANRLSLMTVGWRATHGEVVKLVLDAHKGRLRLSLSPRLQGTMAILPLGIGCVLRWPRDIRIRDTITT